MAIFDAFLRPSSAITLNPLQSAGGIRFGEALGADVARTTWSVGAAMFAARIVEGAVAGATGLQIAIAP